LKDRLAVISKKGRPYFFIALAGILAFAPVSFMLRSLKNDLVALEYPINYFISQCIHQGEIPYWFNTWGMGFPLQSNLTWGIFSTPQMLFGAIFSYDMYALHIEFMFFVVLAGWSMFYLLKKHFLKDERIAMVLACCYMLSGFISGSGQWMLYVTAAAFIPLVLHALLQLLQAPSFRHALLFAVLYFIMFTSVYAALNIITSYSLLIFTGCYLGSAGFERKEKFRILKFVGIAGVMTILLCLPALLSTLELLKYMGRGNPISGNAEFFNSNYLHPDGLGTLLLPFSSVKMNYPLTEGTMLDTYMGLFTLLLLPIAIAQTIKEKRVLSWVIFFSAILFLLISFGSLLPLRHTLNILPGFSYFRNPALFRFYFIFLVIVYLGISLRNRSWENIFNGENGLSSRLLKIVFLVLSFLCAIALVTHFGAVKTISFSSPMQVIRNITFPQSVFISAVIQLFLLGFLFYSISRKKYQLFKFLAIADLAINVLLCTPYFAVSRDSLAHVNAILHSEKGFPLQSVKINEVPSIYIDERSNTWNNVNIFRKQVSSNETYRGPLTLNNFSVLFADSLRSSSLFDQPIAFIKRNNFNQSIKLLLQRPAHIRIATTLGKPDSLTVLQNYFPGWKAFYNNKQVDIVDSQGPGMTIIVPAGEGIIDFRYERKAIWVSALLLHLFVLSFLGWKAYRVIGRSLQPVS
jgi:hypothetical protein